MSTPLSCHRLLVTVCAGGLYALPFLCGCGKAGQGNEGLKAVNVVKEHVERNKQLPEFQWIKGFPPDVRVEEMKTDPNLTHQAYVWVFGETVTLPDSGGMPGRKKGLFVVGKERKSRKWVITSGEKPQQVHLGKL